MNMTKTQLASILGYTEDIDEWYELCLEFFPKYNITTNNRIAAFLAQTGHESLNFKVIEENLNYSTDGLRRVFRKYFTSAVIAKRYARQPERIASRVYANRLGNGPESSKDGWRYRGRGLIQLTGKSNYQLFADYIGKSLSETVEYLSTKKGAFESACWFWTTKNLNYYADNKDIVGMTKLINGGTNGLDDRRKKYLHALSILNKHNPTSGEEIVKEVQAALGVNVDGVFGPKTKEALRAWQKNHGLASDGIIGPMTLKLLLGT